MHICVITGVRHSLPLFFAHFLPNLTIPHATAFGADCKDVCGIKKVLNYGQHENTESASLHRWCQRCSLTYSNKFTINNKFLAAHPTNRRTRVFGSSYPGSVNRMPRMSVGIWTSKRKSTDLGRNCSLQEIRQHPNKILSWLTLSTTCGELLFNSIIAVRR